MLLLVTYTYRHRKWLASAFQTNWSGVCGECEWPQHSSQFSQQLLLVFSEISLSSQSADHAGVRLELWNTGQTWAAPHRSVRFTRGASASLTQFTQDPFAFISAEVEQRGPNHRHAARQRLLLLNHQLHTHTHTPLISIQLEPYESTDAENMKSSRKNEIYTNVTESGCVWLNKSDADMDQSVWI